MNQKSQSIKKVLCFGTFDIVHPGHIYFLKQAKKYGDFLTVVIARDLTVLKVKGRIPKNHERKRLREIEELSIADRVILGDENDPYKIIERVEPDIICLGYDQKAFVDGLKAELKKIKINCKIYRIGAHKPEIYKSSTLRHFRGFD